MKILRFRVLMIGDQVKKDDAGQMYEILEEIRTES
jgi:hypothetical protein